MHLDKKRPYGSICGSTGGAKFEQDGRLFDINGHELGAPPDTPTPPEPLPAGVPSVVGFIRVSLADGDKKNTRVIAKEAEACGFQWSDVLEASKSLPIVATRSGPHTFWQMVIDNG
jgi:hypothetical protein